MLASAIVTRDNQFDFRLLGFSGSACAFDHAVRPIHRVLYRPLEAGRAIFHRDGIEEVQFAAELTRSTADARPQYALAAQGAKIEVVGTHFARKCDIAN